jgi:hypothetical protein
MKRLAKMRCAIDDLVMDLEIFEVIRGTDALECVRGPLPKRRRRPPVFVCNSVPGEDFHEADLLLGRHEPGRLHRRP